MRWWSEALETLKKEVATRKSRILRFADWGGKVRKPKVVDEYLENKDKYKSEAVKNQIASWKELCEKQDRIDMWERVYRVIGRTKKREEDLPLEMDGKMLDAKGDLLPRGQ